MCGIVGAITKAASGFTTKDVEAFGDLIYMDTLRGSDSTGIIGIDKDGNVDVAKDALPGCYFMYSKEFREIADKKAYNNGRVLVGHNRKATIGKVNVSNAHPFVINDEFVLVHNGSLTSHKNLAETESDSHAIATYLHKNYQEKDLGKLFSEIHGAYALVWYDLRTNKLNIIRNHQRPLWIAETNDAYWFASEIYMLWAALDRHDLKWIKDTSKVFEANKLYTLDLEGFNYSSKFEVADVPFVQPPSRNTGKRGSTVITSSTANTTDTNYLSRKDFKRISSTSPLVGRTINFDVEDFVDHIKTDGDYWFYGTSDDVKFAHDIIGECSETVAMSIIDNANMAQGVVTKVDYDKQLKRAQIHVSAGARTNAHQTCH
jgi:predicted glutamine amidotransferase